MIDKSSPEGVKVLLSRADFSLSPCGQKCLNSTVTSDGNCALTDIACICSFSTLQYNLAYCEGYNCGSEASNDLSKFSSVCQSKSGQTTTVPISTPTGTAGSPGFTAVTVTVGGLTSVISWPTTLYSFSTQTAGVTQESTSAPTASSSSQSSGPPVGAIVGGVVGGVVGLLVLLGLVGLIIHLRRKLNKAKAADTQQGTAGAGVGHQPTPEYKAVSPMSAKDTGPSLSPAVELQSPSSTTSYNWSGGHSPVPSPGPGVIYSEMGTNPRPTPELYASGLPHHEMPATHPGVSRPQGGAAELY